MSFMLPVTLIGVKVDTNPSNGELILILGGVESRKIVIFEEPTKEWSSYLRDEIVNVKAVESSGKWNTLLVKGQDKKKDP